MKKIAAIVAAALVGTVLATQWVHAKGPAKFVANHPKLAAATGYWHKPYIKNNTYVNVPHYRHWYGYGYYGYKPLITPVAVPTPVPVAQPVVSQPVVQQVAPVRVEAPDNVDVSIIKTEIKQIPAGTRVRFNTPTLIDDGRVVLKIGAATRRLEIVQWNEEGVVVDVPVLNLTQPREGRILILDRNGRIRTSVDVEVVAG
ncbi:MAG: hypothetical protein R3E01_01420 [Pirellulaceae bacterium]